MTASPVENGFECSFYCDHGCGEHLEIGVFVAPDEFLSWSQVGSTSGNSPDPAGSTQTDSEISIKCPGCSNEVKMSAANLNFFSDKSMAAGISEVSLQALALYQSQILLPSGKRGPAIK
jgi:hypothetical protein